MGDWLVLSCWVSSLSRVPLTLSFCPGESRSPGGQWSLCPVSLPGDSLHWTPARGSYVFEGTCGGWVCLSRCRGGCHCGVYLTPWVLCCWCPPSILYFRGKDIRVCVHVCLCIVLVCVHVCMCVSHAFSLFCSILFFFYLLVYILKRERLHWTEWVGRRGD